MPQDPETARAFHVGLCMAGAVSAGAYTAGVFDFLIQALEEWERARRETPDAAPRHRVLIPVVSGASAGGITGALGVAALAGGTDPQPFAGPRDGTQPWRCMLPRLYETWVEKPKMIGAPGEKDLLGLDDLAADGRGPIRSLLNAGLLNDIARQALPAVPPGEPFRPPYIADPFHLYLTVSNVRGVPYSIKFRDGAQEKVLTGHAMMSHGDRIYYRVRGIGGAEWTSPWTASDQAVAIDAQGLFAAGGPSRDWLDFAEAALATSAFPLGLAPRALRALTGSYRGRSWPMPMPDSVEIVPDWPPPWDVDQPDRAYEFVNVDGGLINNEPFEIARSALLRPGERRNPRDAEQADTAVIMIDPFPDGPSFATDYVADESLRAIALALVPMLRDQVRFKPSELALAVDEGVFSRFLIAPRRTRDRRPGEAEDPPPEKYAIACGVLGGFGGFLDEAFRAHDFQLGRRNCQKFLLDCFTVPPENGCIRAGYAGLPDGGAAFRRPDGNLPILPLLGTAALEVPLSVPGDWPKMDPERLDVLEERVRARADAVVTRLIDEQLRHPLARWGLRRIWSWVGSDHASQYVRLLVQKDLILRDLLGGAWRFDREDVRRVMAALTDPKWHVSTLAGLRRETGLDPSAIGGILDAVIGRGLVRPERIDGKACYRLSMRSLPWTRHIPLLRNTFPISVNDG